MRGPPVVGRGDRRRDGSIGVAVHDDDPTVIREATTLDDLAAMRGVFATIWGEGGVPELNLLRAVQWSGGYASVAVVDGVVVGGSFGFLGGQPNLHLHSHITGVLAGQQDRSIGFELKQHQRRWCLQHAIPRVRWTFDPLVRRNAWFNLRRLGAVVEEFHADFYGEMHDLLNEGEHTDRFIVRWDIAEAEPVTEVDVPRGAELFALPPDIMALRAGDPDRAATLRIELRAALQGRRVAGITDAFEYVLVDA
jgi:predicted GNAT superfamily acetyltransferase